MRTLRSTALVVLVAATVVVLVYAAVDGLTGLIVAQRWQRPGWEEPAPGAVPAADPAGSAGRSMTTGDRAARPSSGGYAVAAATTRFDAGRTRRFAFRILDRDGTPVTEFRRAHEKLLHLIVVRRDLTEYQHLHPTLARDGTWSIRLSLPRAGRYRAFMDIATDRGPFTLNLDLRASGRSADAPLPAPSAVASTGPYTVALDTAAVGTTAELRFQVSTGDRPVADLERYMGARGHLVVVRASDLAYLHVHPEDGAGAGHGHAQRAGAGAGAQADGTVGFRTRFPSSGAYRMFLQFRHQGAVQTVPFTFVVP
jgi:hypothetical protein